MAGVSPHDISVALIYDNFTAAVLFCLEHVGFCTEGVAGAFVEGGTRITLGDPLPINTEGGNLSNSYMQGWPQNVEACGSCAANAVSGRCKMPSCPASSPAAA